MNPEDLRDYLQHHKFTPSHLADCLGVTKGAVLHWVDGRRGIPTWVSRVLYYFEDNKLNLENLKYDI